MPLSYTDALDYLATLIVSKRRERFMPLEVPRKMMAQLNHPHESYPIIHITGTKGKGSVGAMTAAILQASGLRVGLFSSPHLQDFRERIKINQQMIGERDVITLVNRIKPIIKNLPEISWFGAVSAMAFTYFKDMEVDIAVIEVGLGGRYDATNLVTPIVSVITSLSYDHMAILGHSLQEIAFHKAGIIKKNVPVVSAPQHPEALAVIERTAVQMDAPFTLVGRDWQFESQGSNLKAEYWQAGKTSETLQHYQTTLLGEHQAINGTVSLATIDTLCQQGFSVPLSAIQQGLMQVNWPGRLEIIGEKPRLILDAAHNADSAHWLKRALLERFPDIPRVLVFGAKSDKDIEGMLAELLPAVDYFIVTLALDSRAEAPDVIADIARRQGFTGTIELIPFVPDALETARQYATQTGLVCVTGSIYLVGEVRTFYGLKAGQAVNVTREK